MDFAYFSLRPLRTAAAGRRRVLAATAAGLALAAAAPDARAAGPSWLPPLDTALPTAPFFTDMVVAPDGTTVVGLRRDIPSGTQAEVVVRPPGGGFGAPAALSSGQYSGHLRLAADRQGNVAATWHEQQDGTQVVRVATKAPGQPFGPARTVSDPVNGADFPEVAIGGGHVVVTWFQNRRIRAAVGEVGGGFTLQPGFSTPSPVTTFPTPRVAVADSGAAVIAWSEFHGEGDFRVHVAARPANGTFKALPDLKKAGYVHDVAVAMAPNSHATVAWARASALGSPVVVEAASRGATGDFAPVDRVSDPAAEKAKDPHLGLAVSADNTAYAVWHGEDGWYAGIRPAGSAFGPATRIPGSTAGDSVFARTQVATAPDGSAIAVWNANAGDAPRGVESARLRPDGTVGATTVLAATAPPAGFHGYHDNPVGLGIDDEGNAATLWKYNEYPASSGGPFVTRVQLERFDAAPPRFDAVSVPATAVAGRPVAMSAAATDRWSTVELGWDFGDNSAAAGAPQTHVFASPGRYEIEINAVDEAVNGHAEYRTIEVSGRRPNG